MKSYRRLLTGLLLSAAGAGVFPTMAVAQTAPAADDGGLTDIVVTARKRAENLQVAPISVNAFSGAALESARIQNFADIATRVPGVAMNPDNITEPNIFIRGVGTDIESAASSPAIGFFANDVYLSRAQGTAMEIFDLDRVEVVRGPQGTLYGKNVVGGAVNYVIAKPERAFAASGEAAIGNYQNYEAKGMVNGGLTDTLSGRIAFSVRERDGFAHNTYTGHDAEALNAIGIRAQLRYQPDSDLDILLSGDKTRRRDGAQWVDMLEPSDHNAPFKNPDPRKGPNNIDGRAEADIQGTDLHIDWNMGAGTLTSITAYRDAKFLTLNNDAGSFIDFRNFTYFPSGQINIGALTDDQFASLNDDYYVNRKTEKVKTFSQELRYHTAFDGPFNLMAGLFYMHEDVKRLEDANYIFVLYYNNGGETAATRTKTDTYAAFLEGAYDFTSTLSLTGGIRYTRDHKKFGVDRGVTFDNLGRSFEDEAGNTVTSFSASASRSFSAWTPSATLNWKVTPDAFLYATVSRGYKSGGWNGENATSPAEAREGYNPEFAWNYEAGAKTEWFDHRLRLNLTGFWTQYTDLQTQQYVIFDANLPANNIIANAGKARVRGIEFEALAAPVKGLTFGGNMSFMKGKITGDLFSTALQYNFACDCQLPVSTNLKGNVLRRTPEWSYTLFGAFETPLSDSYNAFINVDYNWSDKYFFENENDKRTEISSRGVLNGSVGLSTYDKKWTFSVWAKNITKELYVTGKSDNIGTVLVSYAPPRTYGLSLSWKY